RDAPRVSISRAMRFELWRQDDNGNRVRIDVFASEAEAEAERAGYEARAHKQLYWVQPAPNPEKSAG
ncbi:MAG TPA: hypothetical protein VM261_25330, partial [Kofleriaceae bacterium]|nr:hypothetical protein [Kofleriaceae bacterium]